MEQERYVQSGQGIATNGAIGRYMNGAPGIATNGARTLVVLTFHALDPHDPQNHFPPRPLDVLSPLPLSWGTLAACWDAARRRQTVRLGRGGPQTGVPNCLDGILLGLLV